MTGPLALSAALLALYGAAHCAAMCGGFVAATFVPPSPGAPSRGRAPSLAAVPMHAGRLASYATAGAIAGAVGATPALLLGSARFQAVLFSLGALVIAATGLRIAGVALPRAPTPRFLEPLWRRVTSLAWRRGRPDTALRRLGLGVLWGWAPCALVYSALPLALVSGSAASGAWVMLAFGAGTMPALAAAGWLVGRGMAWWPGPVARRIAGGAMVVLAVAGILQALELADTALGAFCVPRVP